MVTAQARIRAKSQLTLPDPIVRAAGVTEGDRYIVEVSPDAPDTIRFHRIRSTYAGALAELFPDGAGYLEHERSSWTGRRE
jgi:bifunctional DNA-binding transcriptional regulator/antitoxin component of YhaV-PrlF toxin-antitoxin module